jgi:sporulation protein YlmC with PRC-barrel domain
MGRKLGLALVAATLAAAPALAQQTEPAPSANPPAKAMTAPGPAAAPSATTATNTSGPSGSLQKSNDGWRTSKLVGATVFNDKGDTVGTIDDLLTDDSGKITQAVISTGGILGMGSKLVAVPFNELKFQPSAGNNGAAQPAATLNTPAGTNPPAAGSASTTTAANSSHSTYYSVVLPDATKDSLSKQQTFKYASTG